jgi:hypothetical protein
MVSLNKLLMSLVIVTAVVVKAEEAEKAAVVTQENEMYTFVKGLYKKATSQENVDTVKDYTNKGLEKTEEVFTQYPMYVPAAYFLGRASMAAKAINKVMHVENLPKNLLKTLKRTKVRNMYVGFGLLGLDRYYNRNEQSVTTNKAA